MTIFYKKQETLNAIFWDGIVDPRELFSVGDPLTWYNGNVDVLPYWSINGIKLEANTYYWNTGGSWFKDTKEGFESKWNFSEYVKVNE